MSGRGSRREELPEGVPVSLPAPGGVLAVLATSDACESCSAVRSRLDALAGVTVQVVQVADRAAVERHGIDRIPQLWLVDSGGAVLRHWVGEPLAGTLERTVEQALADPGRGRPGGSG